MDLTGAKPVPPATMTKRALVVLAQPKITMRQFELQQIASFERGRMPALKWPPGTWRMCS
jgi:hypothetical protein